MKNFKHDWPWFRRKIEGHHWPYSLKNRMTHDRRHRCRNYPLFWNKKDKLKTSKKKVNKTGSENPKHESNQSTTTKVNGSRKTGLLSSLPVQGTYFVFCLKRKMKNMDRCLEWTWGGQSQEHI